MKLTNLYIQITSLFLFGIKVSEAQKPLISYEQAATPLGATISPGYSNSPLIPASRFDLAPVLRSKVGDPVLE